MTLIIDDDVAGLKVPIDDLGPVKSFDSQYNFGHILFERVFTKNAIFLDQSQEIATGTVVHDQVEFLVGLESPAQLNHKGMVDG